MKWIRSVSFFTAVLFLFGVCAPAMMVAAQPNAENDTVILARFDEPDRTDAVAFAMGTSTDALAAWFANYFGGFTGYDEQGNAYDFRTDTWFLGNVDTGIPGVYYAWAAPDLGDGYVFGDGVSLPHQLCAVSIQTSGQPDINCCVSARGFLHFPWVLSPEQQKQLEQFTVWLRKDGGSWVQLYEGFLLTSDDLQLSQRIFEQNCSYDLQVFFPGGQTGILSFQYDDDLLITDYSGGDRDGGDVGGSAPSTDEQPAPVSPTTPSDSGDSDCVGDDDLTQYVAPTRPTPEPVKQDYDTSKEQDSTNSATGIQNEPDTQTITDSTESVVQESYSPTQTVISGLRLRNLCADEKSVVFGGGDLTVSIPSELLLALNLRDTDTLSIKLSQPKSHQVTFTVEAFGSAVTTLPGTVLRLRYTPRSENVAFTVWNEAREKTADVEYNGEFLRFSVDKAGTYTISETAEASETTAIAPKEAAVVSQEVPTAPNGKSPMLPLVGGGLLLAVGGTALVRRKSHG